MIIMSLVYINGTYVPIEQAKISPMDRGFLFGDGIYEVIPSYGGALVGFALHMQRMNEGLSLVGIVLDCSVGQWLDIAQTLVDKNGGSNLGVYLHVSRGTDSKRFHGFPKAVKPTVFAFAFDIAAPQVADKTQVKGYRVTTTQDLRWKNCNIKSTSMLGNVMHFQQGYEKGYNETILYSANHTLTEGSSSNVCIVKDNIVITPPLDHQILPGITRWMLLDILRKDGTFKVEERVVSMNEVVNADEVWLTSSSKEMVSVIEIDGKPVGNGKVGDVWQAAYGLYMANKYSY